MRLRLILLHALSACAALLLPSPSQAEIPWSVAVLFWSDVSCPDRTTLVSALDRRGLEVVGAEGALSRLELGMRGTDVSITLRDRGGQILAERMFSTGDCTALGDAMALLVQRRLEGVDWEGAVPNGSVPLPPAQPPAHPPPVRPRNADPALAPAPWGLQVKAGVVFGTDFEDRGGRPGPAIGLRLLPPGLLDAGISVAWLHHADLPIEDVGSLDLDRFPVAFASNVALLRPRWEARAGAVIEVDVLALESHLPRSASRVRAALRLGPAVSLAFSPLQNVWVEIGGALPVKVLGYVIVIEGLGTIDRQSRFAIEVGGWLSYRFRT